MTLQEALQKIYSMHQFDIKLGLDKIVSLLNFIGNPQKKLKAFHVAGSNGKGSTASFLSSILIEAGYKTGLYTSPHLIKFNERVRINGNMISDEYIANFINEIDDYIDTYAPTFFEITTALAFKYFADNNTDFVVIETGLGGRLDATNTLNPLATIFTSISLEHTNILGNSITQIASEKAGICKPKTDIILSILPNEAIKVFQKKAEELNSEFIQLKNYISNTNDTLSFNYNTFNISINNLPLHGLYQKQNAALAILTLLKKLPNISKLQIERGLENVVKNSGIQGRFEYYNSNPNIIFDAAHNEEGVDAFIEVFKKCEDNNFRKILIFGGMSDKNLEGMLKKLNTVFDDIYVTSINYERAAKPEQFFSIANSNNILINFLEEPVNFIENFKKNESNSVLAVLGSIYLLGEIKENLIKRA